MNIDTVYIKSYENSNESRLKNIENIIKFANEKLEANVIVNGISSNTLRNPDLINVLVNNNIIPNPTHAPDKISELVFDHVNDQFMNVEDLCTFISHVNFWKDIVDKKIKYSLIIEDDVVINTDETMNTLENIFNDECKSTLEKFWLVSLLNNNGDIGNKILPKFNEHFNYIIQDTENTQKMYIMTYDSAKYFLNNIMPISMPINKTLVNILSCFGKGYTAKKSCAYIDQFIDVKIIQHPVKKIPNIEKFYLITIERSQERRKKNIENIKKFIKDTYGKDIHVCGVDGEKLQQHEIGDLVLEDIIEVNEHTDITLSHAGSLVFMTEFPYRPPFMNASEIGCFLSHYYIWKDMIENEIPYAVVFEDDTKINTKIFSEHLEKIMENAPENFDIISLYKHEKQLDQKYINYNDFFDLTHSKVWGTSAYIISLDAVKNIINAVIPVKYPVDFALQNYMESKRSGYIYKKRIILPYDDISVIPH